MNRQQKAIQEIKDCAERLGAPPTQAQFNKDPRTTLKARTIAACFPGGWKEALSQAGLQRGPTDKQILDDLKALGQQLGRMPTSRDINASKSLPSSALYMRRFGSLDEARSQAGLQEFDRSSAQYMIKQGLKLAEQLGHLPSWSEWEQACEGDPELPSQWQVYRRFGGGDGAWKMFHYCLLEEQDANS